MKIDEIISDYTNRRTAMKRADEINSILDIVTKKLPRIVAKWIYNLSCGIKRLGRALESKERLKTKEATKLVGPVQQRTGKIVLLENCSNCGDIKCKWHGRAIDVCIGWKRMASTGR